MVPARVREPFFNHERNWYIGYAKKCRRKKNADDTLPWNNRHDVRCIGECKYELATPCDIPFVKFFLFTSTAFNKPSFPARMYMINKYLC